MTKKKNITIVIIVAVVLLVGYFAIGILLPRILLSMTVDKLLNIGESAPPFTHYDIKTDNTVEISNGKIAVTIPDDYIQKDLGELKAQMYGKDEKASVILMEPEDGSYMNLLAEENLKNYDVGVRISADSVKRGFEKIGNGFPDTAYTTYKCVYMLDEEDYSFWDLEQGVAYAVTGVIKQIIPQWGQVYLYENEEICGFVHINQIAENDAIVYRGTLELYSKSDLNTINTLLISVQTVEEIYEILNSARPVA